MTRLRGQIAITQVRLGDLAGATQTASALPSDFDKAKALVEIGSAHAAAGNRVDAREILLAAARAAQNVTPGTGMDGPTGPTGPLESAKAATMRQIAEKQANVGDIKDALHTAESIPTNTINMKDNALAAIVQAQAEAGDVQGALETVERIQQDNTKAFALRNLVKAQVKAGDEQGALALAARQTSPLLRVYVLLGVAEGRAKQRATRE